MKSIGYVRSYDGSRTAIAVQENLIRNYCKRCGIKDVEIIVDVANLKADFDRFRDKYVPMSVENLQDRFFKEWTAMVRKIRESEIHVIIVDSILRLFSNYQQKSCFLELCREKGVEIIEICETPPPDSGRIAAVCHFTNVSERKPRVVLEQLDILYKEAVSKFGTVSHIYLDRTLVSSKQKNLKELIQSPYGYKGVVIASLYHIGTYMTVAIQNANRLLDAGVTLYSATEGYIRPISKTHLLDEELRVAIYDREMKYKYPVNCKITEERLRVFIAAKTRWTLGGVYYDSIESGKTELERLASESEKYDLVVLEHFGKFNFRTGQLYKMLNKVKLNIFSIREGGVYFDRGDRDNIQGNLLRTRQHD